MPFILSSAQQMTKDFRPDTGEKQYTFDDVQGIDEAKAEVQEIVEFLKNPEKFQRLGAKLPTGKVEVKLKGFILYVYEEKFTSDLQY